MDWLNDGPHGGEAALNRPQKKSIPEASMLMCIT